jgi:hypothetical protein
MDGRERREGAYAWTNLLSMLPCLVRTLSSSILGRVTELGGWSGAIIFSGNQRLRYHGSIFFLSGNQAPHIETPRPRNRPIEMKCRKQPRRAHGSSPCPYVHKGRLTSYEYTTQTNPKSFPSHQGGMAIRRHRPCKSDPHSQVRPRQAHTPNGRSPRFQSGGH